MTMFKRWAATSAIALMILGLIACDLTTDPPRIIKVFGLLTFTATDTKAGTFDLATYFEGEEDVSFAAESSNVRVVTAAVTNSTLTITPKGPGSAVVTVTATDGNGTTSMAMNVRKEAPPAPMVTSFPSTITFASKDAGAQTLTLSDHISGATGYTATASPEGVVDVAVSGGVLTITPVAAGDAVVTVRATTAHGGATLLPVNVVVEAPVPAITGRPRPLTFASSDAAAQRVTLSSYITGATSYSATALPPGVVTASIRGGVLTIDPMAAGNAEVTVTATNENGSSHLRVYVNVGAPLPDRTTTPPSAVTFASPDAAAQTVMLSDHISGATGYAASTAPSGVVRASISGGVLTLTPMAAGSAVVTVTASNANGSILVPITVLVREPEIGPVPEITPHPGVTFASVNASNQTVTVSDYISGATEYELTGAPWGGVVFATLAGNVLTLRPVAAGNAVVTVIATNDNGSSRLPVYVKVDAPPPRITGSPIPVTFVSAEAADQTVQLDHYISSADSYTATADNDDIVTLDISGDVLTITPEAVGTALVTVVASNANGTATLSIQVVVNPAPVPGFMGMHPTPVTFVSPTAGPQTITLSDFITGADPDEYEVTSTPAGIVQTSVSGHVLTITPASAGEATVAIRGRNQHGLSDRVYVTVVVREPVVVPPPVSLQRLRDQQVEEDQPKTIDLSQYFSGARSYRASSADSAIVTASVSGTMLTLTPQMSAGARLVTVTVTASNPGGNVAVTIRVSIVMDVEPLQIKAADTVVFRVPDIASLRLYESGDLTDGEKAYRREVIDNFKAAGDHIKQVVAANYFYDPTDPLIYRITATTLGDIAVTAKLEDVKTGEITFTYLIDRDLTSTTALSVDSGL